MFGFDKMFDFDRDGKLDSWERAAQFQFMDEMMKNDEKSIFDDDDKSTITADTGPEFSTLNKDFEDTDTDIFYAHSYTSCDRGSNEAPKSVLRPKCAGLGVQHNT